MTHHIYSFLMSISLVFTHLNWLVDTVQTSDTEALQGFKCSIQKSIKTTKWQYNASLVNTVNNSWADKK